MKLVGVPRVAAPKPGAFSNLRLFETGRGRETPIPPAEQQDLIRTLQPEVRDLALKVAAARPAPATINADQRSRLRALGYVD